MDESVIRAMAKWPNVPCVYGWLSLDRRGRWRLRDEPITHPGANAFVGRNYGCDDHGNWFFQNGPQKVFVALEYTPWVVFSNVAGGLRTHTGLSVGTLLGVWLDDEGSLILLTQYGPALVCDRDLVDVLSRFRSENGRGLSDAELAVALESTGDTGEKGLAFDWRGVLLPVGRIPRAQVPNRLSFVRCPADLGKP